MNLELKSLNYSIISVKKQNSKIIIINTYLKFYNIYFTYLK